jgi:periplasmic copper chaperone A
MKRRLFLALPFLTTPAHGHSYKSGHLKIGHAWALPALAGQEGQCFMPILNTVGQDALVAARSAICSTIELRRNARYDDPAETQFELKQNQPLAMRPQARHLRLIGMRQDIQLDDRFKLILDFLNGGEVEVEVHVENTPGD